MNGMYAVICGYQFSHRYRNVGIGVTSRYNFQRHICQNWIKINLYNVKGACTQTFGSKVVTGYRNVSCIYTSRFISQRYNSQNQTTNIGDDVNGMYAVTCGYHFAPRNVGIRVTSSYNFQRHVCKNLIKVNLYSVKGTCTEAFGSKVITGYRNVSCRDTPVIISSAIFSRIRSIL